MGFRGTQEWQDYEPGGEYPNYRPLGVLAVYVTQIDDGFMPLSVYGPDGVPAVPTNMKVGMSDFRFDYGMEPGPTRLLFNNSEEQGLTDRNLIVASKILGNYVNRNPGLIEPELDSAGFEIDINSGFDKFHHLRHMIEIIKNQRLFEKDISEYLTRS